MCIGTNCERRFSSDKLDYIRGVLVPIVRERVTITEAWLYPSALVPIVREGIIIREAWLY